MHEVQRLNYSLVYIKSSHKQQPNGMTKHYTFNFGNINIGETLNYIEQLNYTYIGKLHVDEIRLRVGIKGDSENKRE